MPQVRKSSTPQLGIQLEGGQGSYYIPGDTICGTIDRRTCLVAPRARVAVTLHGRSKTKIRDPERNSASSSDGYYRDNFTFFTPGSTTLVLFNGPLHIEEGGDQAVWPFAITIPVSIDEAVARPWQKQKNGGRAALDEEALRLPGSFSFGYSSWATEASAFVQYYLEATLRVYSHNSGQWPVATLPVIIRRPPDPGPPIADFALRSQFAPKDYKFRSHRLIPGQEDAEPSSSQKIQRFFHSSQVPCLAVKYETEAPGIIQLEHPIPIPLLFRAVPVWDQTSEAIRGIPQRIRLDWVSLNISAETTASAWGTWNEHSAGGKDETSLGRYSSAEWREEVYLPFSTKDPPLDIGELINLHLDYSGRVKKRSDIFYGVGRLSPAFTTSNFRHGSHRLNWRIRVSVTGETHEMSGSRPVRILPPSCDGGYEAPPPLLATQRTESWAKPPPENEAPPPYCPKEGEQEGESSNHAV